MTYVHLFYFLPCEFFAYVSSAIFCLSNKPGAFVLITIPSLLKLLLLVLTPPFFSSVCLALLIQPLHGTACRFLNWLVFLFPYAFIT